MLAPHSPPLSYWACGGEILARPSLPRFVDGGLAQPVSGPVRVLGPLEAVELAEFYGDLMEACAEAGDGPGETFTRHLADELVVALQSAMNWSRAARGRAA